MGKSGSANRGLWSIHRDFHCRRSLNIQTPLDVWMERPRARKIWRQTWSEKVAIAYFGRDVHLPLIALDLGSQLVPQVRTHYPSEDLMQKSRCFGSNLEVQLVCLHFGTQPATVGLRANHQWHGFSPALDDLGSARKMQGLHFIWIMNQLTKIKKHAQNVTMHFNKGTMKWM